MRTSPRLLLMATLLIAPAALAGQRTSSSADEAAVRAVVARYLHGLKFNDTTGFHDAFWPQALLLFVKRDSTLGQLTQEAWYRGFAKSAGKEEEGDLRIAALDITGTAASVKVIETYPASIYTDYLNLLRIDGKWQIVNKIFTSSTRRENTKGAH